VNATRFALGILAAASLVTAACSASLTTGTTDGPPAASGRAVNGLRYSTASSRAVQAMPAPDTCHYLGSGLFAQPDPRCAPGALSPAVTQENIGRTICRPGAYTASVRPPERVTEPEKRALMGAYGYHAPLGTVELDHIVSLSVGGAVNDAANFYPEPNYPHATADSYYQNPKDRLEERLHDLVCARQLPLARAQADLARDWPAAYKRYVR
jgi:hypothetical protein